MSASISRVQPCNRSRVRYTPSLLTWAALMLFMALPAAAAACHPLGSPVLELEVTAAELAGARKPLSVAVFANDCVHVRLPDHYRRRGEYLVALDAEQRSQLDALLIEYQDEPYDHQQMLAQSRQIERKSNAIDAAERFEVHDADHYALTLHDAGRTYTTRALALFQYAERYPQIRSLDALQRLSAALIGISERDDLVAIETAALLKETSQ